MTAEEDSKNASNCLQKLWTYRVIIRITAKHDIEVDKRKTDIYTEPPVQMSVTSITRSPAYSSAQLSPSKD